MALLPNNKSPWNTRKRGPAVRPFRLWDAVGRVDMQYRYYSTCKRAMNAALLEARWLKVGATIEVYDVRNGKLHGQYTRHTNSVTFTGE